MQPRASEKSVQDELHHASTDLQLQANIVPSLNKVPRCVEPSAVTCDELLDSCAGSLCSNMPQEVQFEGKINAHDSTSSEASLVSFEKVKDDYVHATVAVPMPLRKTMNAAIYSYVAPQEVEDIVPQNPCENESHIAKLSASENKSEMCDSNKCEDESINNMSVRETPHKSERALLQSM